MATHVDASWLIALANQRDQWHAQAKALVPYLAARRPFHIHALAVGEVIAAVGSAGGGKAAMQAYHTIRDNAVVHCPDREGMDAAMQVVLKHDGTVSLSDALFVVLMGKDDEIVSFDADFDKAGVKRVGAPPKGRR